jgi:pimeloyl-ACP methyl ester carboxylesterase
MDEHIPTLPGITSTFVDTPRLQQHILSCGPTDGTPIVLIHGNYSSATYWEELMLELARHGFRCIAVDLRGYGWTEDKLIDSTRGIRDFADDVADLVHTLGIEKFHIVGWSMGGEVVYRYLADHSEQILSATLQAPASPYGFGGTKGLEGTPCYEDCAGSGGGVVNPEFIRRSAAGDRSADDPNSPRNVINAFYYHAGFRAAREEDLLTSAMRERVGSDRYPGDFVPSANWPNVAPGVFGPMNGCSPKYVAGDVPALLAAKNKPPVLWIHGANDQIVGDMSLFDFGTLGKLGAVPGWPGDDVYPPQPMVSQTREVLKMYEAAGGSYREVVFDNCGHAPHIEYQERWLDEFLKMAG